ncbi:MAG TPA: copper resistance CopC family protein [Amycolatopsis sp.]|uniref:copper resistance CopC family protein n=1 Tax=Amycolatopsis sp. TaxID=37632 RepID=UPI002B480D10|nr:copper resistance CopC family protein [Amycolatopsis sp.]HKS48722.1 copper resistance CopC family protein [Amycolatopsis sp.]
MMLRRISAALALTGLAMVAAPFPALAHTELDSSDPAEGASLAAAPTQVRLKFAEAVTLPADPILVTGPGGAKWTVGKASTAGPVVSAPVEATGPAGPYVLDYTVISDDGDQVKGTVHFTLTAAAGASSSAATSSAAPSNAPSTAPASPSPTAQASQPSSGFPAWAWILVVVVVAVVVGGLLVARSRRSSG